MADFTSDVLRPTERRLLNKLRVATVGTVGTFARATGRAVVNLLMRAVGSDGREFEHNPSPQAVVWLPAGDGYGVAFDVGAGDVGVLLAADSGWDQAWQTGQAAVPQSGQRHTFGSAAFLPGGRTGASAAANALGEMRIGAQDGTASIDFSRVRAAPPSLGAVTVSAAGPVASVKLGSASATSQVAKATETKAMTAAGWAAFNTYMQADVTVSPALKLSFAGATAAALAAEAAVPIGSVKVVVDP